MQSQVNQCRALFAYQIFYFRIVIAFVFSAQYQYCLGSHALQGIPAGVDIGRFGIVDEVDAAYTCHFLQAVFHSLEVGKCLADILFGDTCQVCRDSGSQRVVKVMLSGQCQFLLFHVEGDRLGDLHFMIFYVCDGSVFLHGCERIQMCFQTMFCQFLFDDRVIVPEDEGIIGGLVLCNTELGIDVVLHAMVVAVQMIRCDVHQYGDIGTEVIHIVQLERTKLDDVIVMVFFGYL